MLLFSGLFHAKNYRIGFCQGRWSAMVRHLRVLGFPNGSLSWSGYILWAIYNDLSQGHPKWWFSNLPRYLHMQIPKKITRCLFPPWFFGLDGFFGVWDWNFKKKTALDVSPYLLLPVWGRNCTRKKVDSNLFWSFWDDQLFGNRCAGFFWYLSPWCDLKKFWCLP